MSSNTPNLNLYKTDPAVDGLSTFNIKTMLNDNWDKIDASVIAKLLESKGYTDTQIQSLVNAAPGALDTLKELADALGDDPNFRTTILNAIGAKANQSDLVITNGNVTTNAAIVTSHMADYVKHPGYAITTGVANTYAATLSPAPTAYVDGMGIIAKINIVSTGASTINVNNLGAKTIKDSLGNAITSGGLKAITPYTLRYESTSGSFIVQGKGGGGNLVAGDLISGKTATGDSGPIVGTLPIKPSGTLITSNWTDGAGSLHGVIPNGAYLGGIEVWNNDMNFIASNILSGKTVFGLPGTASNIKSIQRGVQGLSSASQTVSIAAVDLTKAIVRISYALGSANVYGEAYIYVNADLTNATTITLTVNSYGDSLTVWWEVIEFNNVKSLQKGQKYTALQNDNVTIASVVPLKSLLFYTFTGVMTDGAATIGITGVALTSATNIQTSQYFAYGKYINWQVVEFN